MRVLLVNAPNPYPSTDSGEHMGLGYLAATLRVDGHDAVIFDAHLEGADFVTTVDRIVEYDPELLCVSLLYQLSLRSGIELLQRLRSSGFKAPIVLGGHPPTILWRELMQSCRDIDFICLGEAETSLSRLAAELESGTAPSEVELPGVATQALAKSGSSPARMKLVRDLDTLPLPARDYLEVGYRHNGFVPMVGSRGCYAKCSFCSIQLFYSTKVCVGPPWRGRSPDRIAEEVALLNSRYGVDKFGFNDDSFLLPGAAGRKRGYAFADALAAKQLNVQFHLMLRASDVNLPLLTRLRDVGLIGVFLGIESGVDRSLELMSKKTTVDENRRAINIIRELGLDLTIGFIMMDPFSSIDDLQENIDFLDSVGELSPRHLTFMKIYPGAPIVDMLTEHGLLTGTMYRYDFRFADDRLEIVRKLFQAYAGQLHGLYQLSVDVLEGAQNCLPSEVAVAKDVLSETIREFVDQCVEAAVRGVRPSALREPVFQAKFGDIIQRATLKLKPIQQRITTLGAGS